MFDFHFVFMGGLEYDVDNVTKIMIYSNKGYIEKSGEEILSTAIPINTTFLFTPNGNFTISGENLCVIDVKKQDS